MCEYCHQSPHDCRCPNAPDPKIRGRCDRCGEELIEAYEYYTDEEDNVFCSEDCAIMYHGIKSKEWDCEEEYNWWEENEYERR